MVLAQVAAVLIAVFTLEFFCFQLLKGIDIKV